MESSFEGVFLDQSKCSKLSMEEKRELVYEISKWPGGAHEMLQSWSRHEILEVLCAELGKERKYTGLTKLKIIENLMKIVSEKKSLEHAPSSDLEMHSSSVIQNQKTAKRQRKTDHPSRLPFSANNLSVSNGDADLGNTIYCKNLACRATLGRDDPFCKRCSCCICYQYDDNKDPSLWLVCGSELPFEGVSCGMSCHLECALKHERSGISKDKKHGGLDGSYFCVSCGKVNDLIGCCRKQLATAKLTRRVDILCYRVSLSQKLLCGTVKYHKIFEIVDEAAKKLEVEVGPLTGIPVKMGRGIVNRLSSGPEVQKLCTLAVESLDSMFSTAVSCMFPDRIQGSYLSNPAMIRVDNVGATSLTVILGPEDPTEEIVSYTLWHRKANETDYPAAQTCTLLVPNTRFVITGLTPASEYVFKVISQNGRGEVSMCEARFSTDIAVAEVPKSLTVERTQSPTTNCSSLSNPSSVEDENNNTTPYTDLNEDRAGHCFNYHTDLNKTVSADISKGTESMMVDSVSAVEGKHRMGIDSTEQVYDLLKLDNGNSQEVHNIEEVIIDNRSNSPAQTGLECVPFVGSLEGNLPITPCKMENSKDGLGRSGRPKQSNKDDGHGKGEKLQAGSGDSSKKRNGEERPDEGDGNCPTDRDFEFYVKVVRWLECEGHIEKNFRQKFLTWYTLRATPQEVRVVKVFVDTFLEDPASLAGQLVDTFSDSISSTRSTVVQTGFCMKLWH